jgi:hypothetical protein
MNRSSMKTNVDTETVDKSVLCALLLHGGGTRAEACVANTMFYDAASTLLSSSTMEVGCRTVCWCRREGC